MKTVSAAIGSLILVIVLVWVFAFNGLAMFKYFAPKEEAIRRETFEQSKAYRQGMIHELENMRFQYEKSTPSQKDALARIIIRRASDFEDLPPDLRNFINELKRNH